jgi:hypothetical protein
MRMLHPAPLKDLILIDSASSTNEWICLILWKDSMFPSIGHNPPTHCAFRVKGHGSWLHSSRSQMHTTDAQKMSKMDITNSSIKLILPSFLEAP